MGCRNIYKRNFMLNPIQIVFTLTLLFLVTLISADYDWIQTCGVCYCNWNSGKKTADCKNRSLNSIPTELSSAIQVIDFSNNVIPEIRRDEFTDANLQNLHKLFMRNCTLQELSRDALKGLPILIELDLSNNQIRIVHPGTFTGSFKLRKVLFNNNEIEVLENNLFKDLQFLQQIEFRHNRIKRVEINTFVNLPTLSIIYLDSNQLTVLKKESFENIRKLADLSLAQNPWNCSCELQQFRDFAVNKRLYTKPTNCNEPPHLQGKLWSDIPTEHFACRPRIIQPRSGASLDANSENVTFTCQIKGSPRPDVFWIYNKRPINLNDHRLQVRYSNESNRRDSIFVSELTIYGIKGSDKGSYTCVAENRGGKDEADIQLTISANRLNRSAVVDSSSNLLLIICIIAIVLLTLLIIVILILCWYCRRIKKYRKDTTMENGLMSSKILDKSQNGSILEGSVIMEMQKSLLTEVNPVEKPPRRTDIEAVDGDDGHEIKKTLIDETPFGSHDEETNSVALSDTTPRSRQTFVDDGYGTNLPPDLLSFPARVPQSPSLQSSMSNIPDNRLYGKSPLSSPVYQHVVNPNGSIGGGSNSVGNNSGIYGTTPAAFRTLQHPKNRNLVLANNRNNNSPFIPAPIVYPPVVMKQGYMTIPRKPRVPSWAPSGSTTLSEFQPSSPSTTGTASTDFVEPVYDNLGLRTTAGGNSLLNLNKIGSNQPVRYTMKDRPLPATPNTSSTVHSNAGNGNNGIGNPSSITTINNVQPTSPPPNLGNSGKIYEPIHELSNHTMTSDTEPLYGTAKSNHNVTIVPSGIGSVDKIVKIPPRPPPKPKKKISVTSTGHGSTSQLFEDEGEDGTEV